MNVPGQYRWAFLLLVIPTACVTAGAWNEFAVYLSQDIQLAPDVFDGRIVWQQYAQLDQDWSWDIYGADLLDEQVPYPIEVALYTADQEAPRIWGDFVVWQDNSETDWDVYLTDISDAAAPQDYLLTPYLDDQARPAVHGNTVAWQHQIQDPDTGLLDWDIYAADVTDVSQPSVYPLRSSMGNQQNPAVHRNTVVWQDDIYDDWDILGADIWLRNKPEIFSVSLTYQHQQYPAVSDKTVVWDEEFSGEDFDILAADISNPANPRVFAVTTDPNAQMNPDIWGHLVVWQDNRNGNWDIYGYNLITRQEFQITNNSFDQTFPSVSGNLVVWEDERTTVTNIYAVWLDGPEIAACSSRPDGDVDGNCRVDLNDFISFAQNWLVCGLDVSQACL